MIEVENDYETVTYEQPFHSHVYENQLELLLNYYTRTRSNNIPKERKANEQRHYTKLKKDKYHFLVQIKFTKTYQKNRPEKKCGQFHFS